MLQLEECTKAKEKRNEIAELVVRDITKRKTKRFKITVKKNNSTFSILLWQHISVLLDHLQASIQRCEVQSLHIMYYGIPHYLQGVFKK